MKKPFKIKFAPSDKIDSFAYELINLIEKKNGISMDDYPKDDLLYIWKVAEFVKKKLKQN